MSERNEFYVLLTPFGQLSGDGQLLESFRERRDRRGADYPMWYLSPELVRKFQLSEEVDCEAVVASESIVIAWLKLRFGGERMTINTTSIEELAEFASSLPPAPERRDISLNR